ncbi:uncharacterized protein BT62DRAFT_928290 [Guyanagaster necrorhizus]|uniref:Uncharacterized protein n=1 Tax=Guyanagaster necrorhizus TaxID=856835 RepID=A0A9P7VZU0_9AGAR|nr:uncharacterized protein BT62DRAFT_928290 [Guyanagaster necrorhizus MCA 3950]KAG7449577.1 hypothetical protein BT62DRAFT_928290 [Guyanagaster necrorhizus MCA 3950]
MDQPPPSIRSSNALSSATFRSAYSAGLFSSLPTSISEPHDSARHYPVIETGKRRKAWIHVFENAIFTNDEISNELAPQRRKVYVSSLEAHIDALHDQLLRMGWWPVPAKELERHKGLNSKTAKVHSIVGIPYSVYLSASEYGCHTPAQGHVDANKNLSV